MPHFTWIDCGLMNLARKHVIKSQTFWPKITLLRPLWIGASFWKAQFTTPFPFMKFFYFVLISFKNSNSVPYSMFELVSNYVIQKFHLQLFFSVEQVSETVIAEIRILSMNTQWSKKCTSFPIDYFLNLIEKTNWTMHIAGKLKKP